MRFSLREQSLVVVLGLTFVTSPIMDAQASGAWEDPSKHRVQFVTAEEGVQVEVLDWGGSGRPIVLLTGSGNTAHVYDDFAPKLTDCCHVYAITRRGFGASTHTEAGYTNQRLAEDVLQVLESLKIAKPVLIGHSMAWRELTMLGAQHSNRLAGLVYLDAGPNPYDEDPAWRALMAKLPEAMRNPPRPTQADRRSFQAFRDWFMATRRFTFPESELRNMFEANPDGTVGRQRADGSVFEAIAKERNPGYLQLSVPVLSLISFPHLYRPHSFEPKDANERAAVEQAYAADEKWTRDHAEALRDAAPQAAWCA